MKIAAFTIDGNGTFAQDVPAFAAAIAAAGADIILAPGTSRARRSLPAAALRAGAAIDTNAVAVTVDGDKVSVQRWAYRQRILTTFSRAARENAVRMRWRYAQRWTVALSPSTVTSTTFVSMAAPARMAAAGMERRAREVPGTRTMSAPAAARAAANAGTSCANVPFPSIVNAAIFMSYFLSP